MTAHESLGDRSRAASLGFEMSSVFFLIDLLHHSPFTHTHTHKKTHPSFSHVNQQAEALQRMGSLSLLKTVCTLLCTVPFDLCVADKTQALV